MRPALKIVEAPRTVTHPVIVAVTKSHAFSWALMPQILERVKQFCRQYDSDHDPELLAAAVERDFFAESQTFLIFAGHRAGRVVGHLVAFVNEPQWGRKKFLTILQHHYDEGARFSRAQTQEVFEAMRRWSEANGVSEIRGVVLNEKLERRARIFFGFKRDLIQIHQQVNHG